MADSYLITNGPIWTGDAAQPRAQAVVVGGRDLVHVGTRDAAAGFVDGATELIEQGYVSFSADGLSVGGGLYMPDPAALQRYRTAVDREKSGGQLAGIVAALHDGGYETMAHDVLKTAPRGFPKNHPRIDLLRHRGIAMMRNWPVGAWLATAKAKDRVVSTRRAGVPLNEWLARYVG